MVFLVASVLVGKAMLKISEQYRRYPSAENAKRVRDYFERNPSRVWVLQSELLRVLLAAGVQGLNSRAA